jgi:hypothetical protein
LIDCTGNEVEFLDAKEKVLQEIEEQVRKVRSHARERKEQEAGTKPPAANPRRSQGTLQEQDAERDAAGDDDTPTGQIDMRQEPPVPVASALPQTANAPSSPSGVLLGTVYEESDAPPRFRMTADGPAVIPSIELKNEVLQQLAATIYRLTPQDAAAAAEPASFEHLPDAQQEPYRVYVRALVDNLLQVGVVIAPATSEVAPYRCWDVDLDVLAEVEHERWLRQKAAQGWRFGPMDDRDKLQNRSMLPWRTMTADELVLQYGTALASTMGTEALPEHEKVKDRSLVHDMVRMLELAGYRLYQLQ